MSAHTSVAAALNIPELLEAILLELDMRTLLVSAQRVSEQWRAVAVGSVRLQRKLFFAVDDSADKTFNPLLEWSFPFCFDVTSNAGRPAFWIAGSHGIAATPLRYMVHDEACRFLLHQEAFSRPGASWKHMLVHQPPIPFLQQIFTHTYLWGPQGQYIRIGASEGLRMQTLVDAVSALNSEKGKGMVGGLDDPEEKTSAVRVIWHQTPIKTYGVRLLKTITAHELAPGVIVQHTIDGGYGDAPNPDFIALRDVLTAYETYVGNKVSRRLARGSLQLPPGVKIP